ncbi:hypothetical protein IMZ11_38795 [Microtetraspora sp. AC03309]|uniref:hypothetical protein n=1 Tax=Microtetraspora sp. AC03309 TaxID=2779376 RepID=UPI001E39B8A0|nr:hypothetical protein [Microtetraspora sp. AC03309]MCC5581567.1 hypothetical protein [Microtetraspora sp. AC03309]
MPEHLSGLACAVCGARDHLWADHVRGVVECRECGQSALLLDSEYSPHGSHGSRDRGDGGDGGAGNKRRAYGGVLVGRRKGNV